tara:strand:- start:1013 stop:1375 length:363 start_codon:yes stop_codon:yes gene_type:complete
MRFDTVTVVEHVKTDTGDLRTIVIEDFIHLANGNSFPKKFKVSTWNYNGEIPAVGSIVNVQGDPVYDASEQVNPRNNKRTIYVTILNPVFTVIRQAQDPIPAEDAAATLAGPAVDMELPF